MSIKLDTGPHIHEITCRDQRATTLDVTGKIGYRHGVGTWPRAQAMARGLAEALRQRHNLRPNCRKRSCRDGRSLRTDGHDVRRRIRCRETCRLPTLDRSYCRTLRTPRHYGRQPWYRPGKTRRRVEEEEWRRLMRLMGLEPSIRRREPARRTRRIGFTLICSRGLRSIDPIRSGAPISPTSRFSVASCMRTAVTN